MIVTPYGWAYLAIALVLCRVFGGCIWRAELRDRAEHPNSLFHDDLPLIGAFMVGLVGAAIWPLVLVVWGFVTACTRWPDVMYRVFFYEPSGARRARRLERRRAEVARLEKELEIDV